MPLLIVTGSPGIGKTTAVMKSVELLKKKGFLVGGVFSREVRHDDIRIGFSFVDISTGRTATLASVKGTGPTIGKYAVDLAGCSFAAQILKEAISKFDVIIIDELGPMEFKSKEFIECVKELANVNRKIVAVVHKKLNHYVVDNFRQKASFVINVDVHNRDKVPQLLLDRLEC